MLSPAVTEGLIAFHAMTGCDTTSYFYRKGKKTALQVFQHQPNLLRNIGKTEGSAQSETYVDAEKFVCSLYGLPELGLVDSVRASLFRQGKTIDCLPPTSDALKHHVDRCHYQASVWQQALELCPRLPPADGWQLAEGQLNPILTSLPKTPPCLDKIISCSCRKGCVARCSCRKAVLACTAACGCRGQCGP